MNDAAQLTGVGVFINSRFFHYGLRLPPEETNPLLSQFDIHPDLTEKQGQDIGNRESHPQPGQSEVAGQYQDR